MRVADTIGMRVGVWAKPENARRDFVVTVQLGLRRVQCAGMVQPPMATTSTRMRHTGYRPALVCVLVIIVAVTILPV